MNLKGPRFKSFDTAQAAYQKSGQAGPHRALPANSQYIGHSGRKDRIRWLKTQCRPLLKSKDPVVIEIIDMVSMLPDYQKYQLIHGANKLSNDQGITLLDAMNFLLVKFEELKEKEKLTNDDGSKDGALDRGTVEKTD